MNYQKIRFLILFMMILNLTTYHKVIAQSSADHDIKIIERLLGSKVNLSDSQTQNILNSMKNPNSRQEALREITQQDSFYKILVKNFASRMSVRSEEVSIPLNDFSATVIGIVRDNRDAREMLTGNYLYAANPDRIPQGINIPNNLINDRLRSNNHYRQIDNNLFRLNLASILMEVPQQVLNNINNPTLENVVPNPDPAGLLTSFTWGQEHLIAGTNRRAVEYAFRIFLCIPMEVAADTQANDMLIGRDVDRFPGGDHTRFLTSCKGCHTVMDGFRGAFAQWNFILNNDNGFLIHGSLHRGRAGMNNQGIAQKMNQNNDVFPQGHVTTDSSWVNFATRGKNVELFGWKNSANEGQGVGSFARLLAHSNRFSLCMAKRAFNEICARSSSPYENVKNVVTEELAQKFEQSGYNLRELFIQTASHSACK